jgi:hypothetical protein
VSVPEKPEDALASATCTSSPSTHPKTMSALRFAFRGAAVSRAAFAPARIQTRFALPQRATYASAAGLAKEDITNRILTVLKGFERVDQTKVRVRVMP